MDPIFSYLDKEESDKQQKLKFILIFQSIGSRSTNKSSHSPSISITPLPGGRGQNSSSGKGQGHMQSMKPGQPGNNQGRGFVICEVCDGYIKDMEQLRNHMQWIHKVKIHPKMIHNRPPLNCQKCQYRFFTDQVIIMTKFIFLYYLA